ncbi:MAG: hypothetical protein KJ630_24935 [Proteobacteria bacterium]|nr:hypothetical protein [Pseudomonadota bacterium]
MSAESDVIFSDFKNACQTTPGKIFPLPGVIDDAEKYYKITTKKLLLEFITNNGLERLTFVNKSPWRNNFTNIKPLYVFAFKFHTNALPGYIGIVKNETQGNWFIKSFHPPDDAHLSLASKLRELGILSSEEDHE